MPTDYELAVMANGAYDATNDKNPKQIPVGWDVLHKHYPQGHWNNGYIIYEHKILITPPSDEKTDLPLARLKVEWVIAFRGTQPPSLFNWMTNLGLFLGQIPEFAQLPIEPLRDLRLDLQEQENILRLYSLSEQAIAEKTPDAITAQMHDYDNRGYKIKRDVYYITFTGHSLGAAMALVRALEEQEENPKKTNPKGNSIVIATIRAVVFDSPGSYPLHSDLKHKEKTLQWAQQSNMDGNLNIVSYLSGPNAVNTCHKHIGQTRRLYVPHLNGEWSTYIKITDAMLWIYDILLPFYLFNFIMEEMKKNDEQTNLILFLSYLPYSLICYRVGISLFLDLLMCANQHSLTNMIKCFDPNAGEPIEGSNENMMNGAVVEHWPSFKSHHFKHRLFRTLSYPFPFYSRGFLVGTSWLLDKNTWEIMLENQNHFGSVIYRQRYVCYSYKDLRTLESDVAEGNLHAKAVLANLHIKSKVQSEKTRGLELLRSLTVNHSQTAPGLWAWGKRYSIENNSKKAFECYRNAAERYHYSPAQNCVGFCYQKGIGTAPNEKMAVKYYKKALEQGYSAAAVNLRNHGAKYETGENINLKKAIKYYQIAADFGDTKAKEALKRLQATTSQSHFNYKGLTFFSLAVGITAGGVVLADKALAQASASFRR